MLDEKEKDIQLLKKKILIPATQLIQGPELAEIEKEKENLYNQLTDCQAKLLKFPDKENQWKKYMDLVVESEKSMKEKFEEMERKLQEKEKELELRIIPPVARSSEHGIVHAMSHVSLKELEITGLKNQNKHLEDVARKRELERKKFE